MGCFGILSVQIYAFNQILASSVHVWHFFFIHITYLNDLKISNTYISRIQYNYGWLKNQQLHWKILSYYYFFFFLTNDIKMQILYLHLCEIFSSFTHIDSIPIQLHKDFRAFLFQMAQHILCACMFCFRLTFSCNKSCCLCCSCSVNKMFYMRAHFSIFQMVLCIVEQGTL